MNDAVSLIEKFSGKVLTSRNDGKLRFEVPIYSPLPTKLRRAGYDPVFQAREWRTGPDGCIRVDCWFIVEAKQHGSVSQEQQSQTRQDRRY